MQIYLAAVRNAFLQNECAQVENSLQLQTMCIFALLMWLYFDVVGLEDNQIYGLSVGICYSPHPLSQLFPAFSLFYSFFSEVRCLPILADGRGGGAKSKKETKSLAFFNSSFYGLFTLLFALCSKTNFVFK